MGKGWRIGPAIIALSPLVAAAEPVAPPPPVVEWPVVAAVPDAPLAAAWPIDRIPPASDTFLIAAAPAPVLLPLRRCGIPDCLRPASDAYAGPVPDDDLPISQLFTTAPFHGALDERHGIAMLIGAAIAALLWRTRSRRARTSF